MDETRLTWAAVVVVGLVLGLVILRGLEVLRMEPREKGPEAGEVRALCLAEFGDTGEEWGSP